MARAIETVVLVPTGAHENRYIRHLMAFHPLWPLRKCFTLASIAKLHSNRVASQAGRRRFESGRPLLQNSLHDIEFEPRCLCAGARVI